MKAVNKSGIIFVEKLNTNSKYPVYLCKCPICKNTFKMWSAHYYRGDDPCKCSHYALKNKRLYSIWINIKTRCYNSNTPSYKHYGARGITMCDEWKDNFQTFYDWAMSHGYSDDLTIERMDVNGNYEPSNCGWITMLEQHQNKTNTIRVNFNDEIMSLRRVCILIGLNYKTEYQYLMRHGYEAEIQRLNKFIELEEKDNVR